MLNKKRIKVSTDIPDGSFADVVFLLLIFFLVTTTMNKDKGLMLVLPPEGDAIEINKTNICKIFINPAGEVMIDETPIPMNRLQDKINERLEEAANRVGIKFVLNKPDFKEENPLIVSITASEATEYSFFVTVLDQVKKTMCNKISIANYK